MSHSASTKSADKKKEVPVSASQKVDASLSSASPLDNILFLQQTIGNQACERLLNSSASQPGDSSDQPKDKPKHQEPSGPKQHSDSGVIRRSPNSSASGAATQQQNKPIVLESYPGAECDPDPRFAMTAEASIWTLKKLMDEYGWEIFQPWFYGSTTGDVTLESEKWQAYMLASKELQQQVQAALSAHADSFRARMDADSQGSLEEDFTQRFHGEVGGKGGGYFTGYQLLHGSNKSVGDVEITGHFQAVRLGGPGAGYKVTYRQLSFVWNDIVDQNKTYATDIRLAQFCANIANCLKVGPPKDYILHIKWKSDRNVEIAVKGKTKGAETTSWLPSRLFRKVRVGAIDDPLEREADAVAEQVMRMPEPQIQRRPLKEEDEHLRRKEVSGVTHELSQESEKQVRSLQGGGRPLPETVRAFMEPRFGVDFSSVRLHTDVSAVESARAINAQAYTFGHNIVFGEGHYAPDTSEGKRLLAHELAHVVQQQEVAGTKVVRYGMVNSSSGDTGIQTSERHILRRASDKAQDVPSLYGAEKAVSSSSLFLLGSLQQGRNVHTSTIEITGSLGQGIILRQPLRDQERSAWSKDIDASSASVANNLGQAEREHLGALYPLLPTQLQQIVQLGNLGVGFTTGFISGLSQHADPKDIVELDRVSREHPVAFNGGTAVGILMGAGQDLVWNIEGLVDMGKLIFKLTPAGQLQAVVSEAWDFLKDPAGVIAQKKQQAEAFQKIVTGLWQFQQYLQSNPNALLIEGSDLGKVAGNLTGQYLRGMIIDEKDPYNKGIAIGYVVGIIAMEIVLFFVAWEKLIARGAVATGSALRMAGREAAAALKESKFGKQILEIVERTPGLSDITKAMREAPKTGEVAVEAAKGAETAGSTEQAAQHAAQHVSQPVPSVEARAAEEAAAEPAKTVEGPGFQQQMDQWLEEFTEKEAPGAKSLEGDFPTPLPLPPPPVVNKVKAVSYEEFFQYVRKVELPRTLKEQVRLENLWRNYLLRKGNGQRLFREASDYKKFLYGLETRQLSKKLLQGFFEGQRGLPNLGSEAGRIAERIYGEVLVTTEKNSRRYSVSFVDPIENRVVTVNVEPDFMPTGEMKNGKFVSAAKLEDALLIADSKYSWDANKKIVLDDQVKGMLALAKQRNVPFVFLLKEGGDVAPAVKKFADKLVVDWRIVRDSSGLIK